MPYFCRRFAVPNKKSEAWPKPTHPQIFGFFRIFAAVLPPSCRTFSSPFSTLFPYSGFSPHMIFPCFCHPFSVHIPPSCRPDFSAAQPYQNGRVAFHPLSPFPQTSIPAGYRLLSTTRHRIFEGTPIDSREVMQIPVNPQDFPENAGKQEVHCHIRQYSQQRSFASRSLF